MASVAQTDELHLSSLSRVELTEGKDAIVAMQTELNELASRCGQSFAQADLRYFLSRPTVQKKRPVMLSFRNAANSQLEASVFFFEYRLAGCRAGVFATDDTTGRRNLMAAADRRTSIAFKAVRELMRR
ncbi:MAG TPA: hypothetical protein VL495_09415, partial [Edaphobacter sp.]|nr:hypothetical protein [Edaphobacter sp.]